jgi:mono/diheme cytochrome c family protein
MTRAAGVSIVMALFLIVGIAGATWYLVHHGFSARDQPTVIEAYVARRVRRLALPANARDAKNPLPLAPEILAEARAHFADHCASCHGNDGSGETEIGRNLYPKAPDMRLTDTQSLSDGELFYIIHNGIRLTGMPAWGKDPAEQDMDSWKLVHFIRHLPNISSEELEGMKELNPISRHELEEENEINRFLRGEDSSPAPVKTHH